MKSKPNPFLRSASLAASIVFSLGLFQTAHAAEYTWDTSATAGIQAGNGIWGTDLFWTTDGGTTRIAWPGNTHTATFAGSAGTYTVQLSGNIATALGSASLGALNFTTNGYTLQSNSGSLTRTITIGASNSAGYITVGSGVTATIGDRVKVTKSGTGGELNLNGGGTLVIGSGTAGGGASLDTTNGANASFINNNSTLEVKTGGTATYGNSLGLGQTAGGGNVMITGGNLKIAATGSSLILQNFSGVTASSTVTISSGTIEFINTANTGGIRFGPSGGSSNASTDLTGTFNLDGGTVTTNKVFMGGSYTNGKYTAIFNFNGGTLKALKTNNTDFMTGITTAATNSASTGVFVKAGGAVIDSNNFDITIGQALLHDSTLGATLDGGLVKKSAGTLTLTGNNTYTGATNVKDGTVVLSGGDNRLASAAAVVLGDTSTSGKLVLGNTSAASNQTLASLTTTGNGGSVVGGNASTDSVLTLSFASGTVTYSGSLGGAGTNENKLALTKTGAGALLLDGTNTYTGATTVNAGELRIGSANALDGTSGITVTATGAGLSLSGGVSVGSGKTITINGTGIGSFNAYGALTNNGGDNTWAGNVTIGSTGARIGSLSGNLTVSGIIDSGIATTGLFIRLTNSTTNLTLSNENTYLGDTTIVTGGGSVILSGGDNRLPTGTKLIFGSSNVSGILDLNGQDQEVAGMSVAQTSGTYTNEIKSTAAATLTVNTAAASSFAGTITGAIGLSKSGSDTLTLGNSNTYTGDTTIKAGTLALGASGTIANSTKLIVGDAGSSSAVLDVSAKTSGFSIGGTQTLSGIGTVDANTSSTLGGGDGTKYTLTMANGATHAVGNSTEDEGIGSQTIDGSLTYNAGSIFEWDLNGNTADNADRGTAGGYDGVDGTGALVVDETEDTGTIFRIVLGSGVDLDDAFWSTPNSPQTWDDIFSGFSGLTGGFHTSNIDVVGAPENLATIGSFSITGTTLTWTAVPEPTSALDGLLITAGLLRRRRVT